MENEMHRYKELADFLKSRRAKILPSQVGIPTGIRRRTPGLRREEVAQLAGIGLTWYTWLEQGRPIQVSTSVVESLSKVLLLNKQERRHLYLLANQPLPPEVPGYQSAVNSALQHVLDSLILSPALVTDQRFNVIAWNKAACLIFGEFSEMNARQRNIVWAMFTDKRYKELYVDWNLYAKNLLGRFRSICGQYIEDAWIAQFIEELKTKSEEFNQWWPLHEIQNDTGLNKQLNHPDVGVLDFEICNFDVSDNSGLQMVVHSPLPETDTAEKIKNLLLINKDDIGM